MSEHTVDIGEGTTFRPTHEPRVWQRILLGLQFSPRLGLLAAVLAAMLFANDADTRLSRSGIAIACLGLSYILNWFIYSPLWSANLIHDCRLSRSWQISLWLLSTAAGPFWVLYGLGMYYLIHYPLLYLPAWMQSWFLPAGLLSICAALAYSMLVSSDRAGRVVHLLRRCLRHSKLAGDNNAG